MDLFLSNYSKNLPVTFGKELSFLALVKSEYEPSGPSGRSLSRFLLHEATIGVFLLSSGWDVSPSEGYPQCYVCRYPLIQYSWAERGTARVKRLALEHNTMSPARAVTRTTRSGDERTNHEATKPQCFWV